MLKNAVLGFLYFWAANVAFAGEPQVLRSRCWRCGRTAT